MSSRAFGAFQIGLGIVCLAMAFEVVALAPGMVVADLLSLALVWSSFAVTLVGIAYLLETPRVFGKRDDGTLSPVHTVALLPYHVVAHVAWGLTRLGREPAYDEVAPGIHVGRRPADEPLPRDVGHIVDLTAEFPVIRLPAGASYHLLATLDTMPPAFEASTALAERLARDEKPVFIHCAAGRGRSATFAAMLVVARGLAADADGAEQLMRAHRRGVRLRPPQRALVDRFAVARANQARASQAHADQLRADTASAVDAARAASHTPA